MGQPVRIHSLSLQAPSNGTPSSPLQPQAPNSDPEWSRFPRLLPCMWFFPDHQVPVSTGSQGMGVKLGSWRSTLLEPVETRVMVTL
uniref:MSTP082 n=1 Tax=Homo sapiens TaxID=9606 RepID=Q7Z4F9_HUMAN|nr:MSTP082 [Homo sapiens]